MLDGELLAKYNSAQKRIVGPIVFLQRVLYLQKSLAFTTSYRYDDAAKVAILNGADSSSLL